MTNHKDQKSKPVKQRISKACRTCSARRRKCDGDQPRCSVCKRIGVECVYVNSGKKRGRPPSSSSGQERMHHQQNNGKVANLSPQFGEHHDVQPPNHASSSSSTDFSQEHFLPFLPVRQQINNVETDALEHLTALLISWEATDRREHSTIPLKLLTAQKVRFHFDIFWRHVHSHWQILYKPAFTAIPETRLANEVKQPVLDAVICLTATMAARTARDRSTVESICQTCTMDVLSKLIKPSLSVVQALFLHSLRFYGIGDLKRASLFTSCAWQLCIDLGLHIDDRTTHRDPGTNQAKLRALWSCYCLDKLLAAEMERVPAFRSDGLRADLLSEFEPDEFEIVYQKSDLIPESQAEAQQSLGRLHAASSLNLTVRTFRILEQALLRTVHLNADEKISEEDLLASWTRSLALDRELDALAASWPDQFRLQARNVLAVPGVACLVISFHLTKIINFRPYLLVQDRLFRSTGNGMDEASSAQIAAMCCLSSSSAIVQLFSAIPRSSLRYISANNAFALFTAASILMPYSTHESLSIAKECHQSVHKCLVWLDDLGKTWPVARKHRTALDDMAQLLQIPLDYEMEIDTCSNCPPALPPMMPPPQNHDDGRSHSYEVERETLPPSTAGESSTSQDGQMPTNHASVHSKVTSPLGFRGQLALRPFATTSTEFENGEDQQGDSTFMSSGSGITPMNEEEHNSNTVNYNGNMSEPGSARSRHRAFNSNRNGLDAQSDLMHFLDTQSDATTVLDELYLDPSIQALVRQSLSRDTSLWDSSGFKVFQ